jgi:hypothetical protein
VNEWRCDVYEMPHPSISVSAVRCARRGTVLFGGFHVCPEHLSDGGCFDRRDGRLYHRAA